LVSSGSLLALLLVLTLSSADRAQAQTEYTEVCRFADKQLAEISGLTRSVRHPNVLWAINDSSGGPFVYAVDEGTCEILARLRMAGVQARDFEGIASGRDELGRPTIWVGDIGDNRDSWPSVQVLAVREPNQLSDRTVPSRRWSFSYADRPHDAETLLADPVSPRLWVVTKQLASGALVSLAPVLDGGETTQELARVGGLVTDGSISPDGSRYVLRDYVDARIFSGPPPGRELQRITLPVQPQGEAITWSATGDALLIASEGDDRLLRVPIAVEPSPSAEPSRESALEPQRQRPQEPSSGPIPAVTIALVLLAVAALSLVLLIAERARRRGGTAESPEQ
jgi:hypothetical protein